MIVVTLLSIPKLNELVNLATPQRCYDYVQTPTTYVYIPFKVILFYLSYE